MKFPPKAGRESGGVYSTVTFNTLSLDCRLSVKQCCFSSFEIWTQRSDFFLQLFPTPLPLPFISFLSCLSTTIIIIISHSYIVAWSTRFLSFSMDKEYGKGLFFVKIKTCYAFFQEEIKGIPSHPTPHLEFCLKVVCMESHSHLLFEENIWYSKMCHNLHDCESISRQGVVPWRIQPNKCPLLSSICHRRKERPSLNDTLHIFWKIYIFLRINLGIFQRSTVMGQ